MYDITLVMGTMRRLSVPDACDRDVLLEIKYKALVGEAINQVNGCALIPLINNLIAGYVGLLNVEKKLELISTAVSHHLFTH